MTSVAIKPLQPARFRALDASGDPLGSGKVYTYVVGTTTDQTTWTDDTKGTENANPVILDAAGEADIWYDSDIKIKLTDSSDVLQWTRDNIPPDAHTVTTIAALKTVTGGTAYVQGYYVIGDEGGGEFYWDASSTATDNGGTIIKATNVTTGRWLRSVEKYISFKGFGAKGDGSTDDTIPINAALAVGGYLYIQNGTYMVGDSLDFTSNTVVDIHPDAEIKFIVGSSVGSADGMFSMNELTNVYINGNGALLTGERKGSGTDLIVMGVRITGCTNIGVRDLKIEDMAGDGLYIAGAVDNDPIFSENIWIDNVVGSNNMRNGTSILSVKNCWINGCLMKSSNGKDPETGYDFEVEGSNTLMQNVTVTNCKGSDNKQFDFSLVLGGNTTPITNGVGITLDSCMSHDSTTYVETVGLAVINHKDAMANDGFIKINNFTARNVNNHGLFIRNIDKDGQAIELTNITLVDTALTASGNLIGGQDTPFMLYTNTAASAYEDPGNVYIHGLKIEDNTRDRAPYYISSAGNAWTNIKIDGLDWRNSVGETTFPYQDDTDDTEIQWVGKPFVVNRTSSITISQRYSGWRLTNNGAGGAVTFTLPAISASFDTTEFNFYIEAAQVLRIDPNASDKIHNVGNGDGKYVEASAIGIWMKVSYYDADGWLFETNDTSAITSEA